MATAQHLNSSAEEYISHAFLDKLTWIDSRLQFAFLNLHRMKHPSPPELGLGPIASCSTGRVRHMPRSCRFFCWFSTEHPIVVTVSKRRGQPNASCLVLSTSRYPLFCQAPILSAVFQQGKLKCVSVSIAIL